MRGEYLTQVRFSRSSRATKYPPTTMPTMGQPTPGTTAPPLAMPSTLFP